METNLGNLQGFGMMNFQKDANRPLRISGAVGLGETHHESGIFT